MKNLIKASAFAIMLGAFAPMAPSYAGSEICGTWAFGGAFSTYNRALRQANRIGGDVLDLDRSDSPNAGKGYWVVAKGPYSRRKANRAARKWRNRGVRGAYASYRCFIGV